MSILSRRHPVISLRLAVLVAVSAICLLLFLLIVRAHVARLRDSGEVAVQTQQRLIRERRLASERAELARKDAEVRAATLRWADVIADVMPRGLSQRTSAGTPKEAEPSLNNSRRSEHWAFKQLTPVNVPADSGARLARNPIDCFISNRLEQDGLSLRPTAAPSTLARRLWFGVTGLPPSPEEIQQFAGAGHEAFDRLVDRMLASSEFGEHFAQPWLDLARYSDSNGYEEDELRPHAYPYRDFVIWAFNQDLPFDDFVRWQIAGDELDAGNPLAVAATGFATAAPYNTFMPQESERYDELDDIVSTLGAAMLGLSIGCARCHDHPYDDVTSHDYYSLVSIFHPTRRQIRYLLPDGGKEFCQLADPLDSRREEVRQILLDRAKEDNITDLDFTEAEKDLLRQPIDHDNSDQMRLLSLCGRCLMVDDTFIDAETAPLPKDEARYQRLVAEIDQLAPFLPPRPPQGLTLAGSEVVETPVLWGGSLENKGEQVGPRFLSLMNASDGDENLEAWQAWDAEHPQPRPRAALANWMTDRDRGAGVLVARVIVNRIWQQHFGRALAATPSNLGVEGEAPAHPELLEWLANELVQSGWSLKHIHRLILCSATYRQDSECPPETYRIDPENRLFSRWNRQRLTAEMFRDSLLRLGDNLNPRLYGPAFQPSIPRDAIFNRDGDDVSATWPTDIVERPEVWRRSIYILRKRTNPVPLLQLFDAPEGTFSCAQRSTTTVPTQALALWNSDFVRAQSARIATSVRRISEDGDEPEIWRPWLRGNGGSQSRQGLGATVIPPKVWRPWLPGEETTVVEHLFPHVLGRAAERDEIVRSIQFLRQGGTLADLCQVLVMTNEFWYVE